MLYYRSIAFTHSSCPILVSAAVYLGVLPCSFNSLMREYVEKVRLLINIFILHCLTSDLRSISEG